MDETKLCPRCKFRKSVDAFGYRSEKEGSRLKSFCKACASEVAVEYHRVHPKESQAAHRRWAEKNPEMIRAKSLRRRNNLVVLRSTLQREYGITLEEYLIQALAQQGLCAICHQLPVDDEKLCVDHDHVTGEFRGLLCRTCNAAYGSVQRGPLSFKTCC